MREIEDWSIANGLVLCYRCGHERPMWFIDRPDRPMAVLKAQRRHEQAQVTSVCAECITAQRRRAMARA